ncbi:MULTISPECIES: hypothetical protein [Pseudanabaena]|uniref:Uncharacterized protein n=1 Tax=Pseudanabaena catenata USMAC16 TaxID=1855837 RepID=A0A9X4RJY9_9CYAN|nr:MULTISPECIES: hypothetical protein [Pseudanabaena]MDG3497578.1 hypothetical protein [Pseudanabaena catenata USMAC16]
MTLANSTRSTIALILPQPKDRFRYFVGNHSKTNFAEAMIQQ